jgi:hypothetical protein
MTNGNKVAGESNTMIILNNNGFTIDPVTGDITILSDAVEDIKVMVDETDSGSVAGASGVTAGSAPATGASGAVSTGAGTQAATQETASKAFEGSIKQQSDIGTEEADAITQSTIPVLGWLNAKRTYDVYQNQDLKVTDGLSEYQSDLRGLKAQAYQNAIETANMVAKQAVRHADIAIDRQWNVDEQGFTVAEILRDNSFKDAIAAAVAIAVNTNK